MTIPFDTRILKFALAGGALAYAVQLYSTGYIGSGIGMTLIGLILGVTALRSIRMILVAFRIQQQKLDKARAILDGINPKHLWKSSRGQYWFLKGNLLLESSLSEAEKAFRHALDIGMKRDEEKAAVMLNLAAIQSSKRRTKEARALIAQAKSHGAKEWCAVAHPAFGGEFTHLVKENHGLSLKLEAKYTKEQLYGSSTEWSELKATYGGLNRCASLMKHGDFSPVSGME